MLYTRPATESIAAIRSSRFLALLRVVVDVGKPGSELLGLELGLQPY
jgi:hypothetical protein